MKIMVSYKYTGESVDGLDSLLSVVCNALCKAGADPYCIYFAKVDGLLMQKSPSEMMRTAFSQIDGSDALLVVQSSESRSEGMLMEVGYAIASKIPVIVATRSSVLETYLPTLADVSIAYDDNDHLRVQIENFNFTSLRKINNSNESYCNTTS